MRKYRIVGSSLLLLAVMCMVHNPNTGKKKISIVYASWLEGIVMSYLAKVVPEKQGYKVELFNANVAPTFASVSCRKADMFTDARLSMTMKDYVSQYGDQIEFIGEIYDNARVGLAVPQYVSVDSVGEPVPHKERLSSKIVGIDAETGIMRTADKAIVGYRLDGYKLFASSSSVILASLQKVTDKESWTAITRQTPRRMFDRYPLKFLHDLKGTYGSIESIYIVGWKGFMERDPFTAKFFNNIKFTTEKISSLVRVLKNVRMNEEGLVRKRRSEHRELIENWIPES